jgi:hypothetical protein
LGELESFYQSQIRRDAPAGKLAFDLFIAREGLTIEA